MAQPPDDFAGVRADAARNRARLLEAAAWLVAERGAEHVTMHEVARAAGVGKGTLFRRFGDRNGLLLALLDDVEAEFHETYACGPPPLAPPICRLVLNTPLAVPVRSADTCSSSNAVVDGITSGPDRPMGISSSTSTTPPSATSTSTTTPWRSPPTPA